MSNPDPIRDPALEVDGRRPVRVGVVPVGGTVLNVPIGHPFALVADYADRGSRILAEGYSRSTMEALAAIVGRALGIPAQFAVHRDPPEGPMPIPDPPPPPEPTPPPAAVPAGPEPRDVALSNAVRGFIQATEDFRALRTTDPARAARAAKALAAWRLAFVADEDPRALPVWDAILAYLEP